MEIRLAEESDHAYLVREYLQHYSPDFSEAQRYAESNMKWDRTLILEEDGLILGTLSWGAREGIQSGIAQLTGLRIIPSRRRQGLAGRLLEAGFQDIQTYFKTRSSPVRRVFAFVPEEQPGAHRLLTAKGFDAIVHLQGWSEEGVGGWLYVLFLT